MSDNKKALLLIGSPKPEKESACASLGELLRSSLVKNGVSVEKIDMFQSVKSREGMEKMLTAIESAGILVFLSPLYADTLPSPVIRAMEFIEEMRNRISMPKIVAAISVCGFPEACHNMTALRVYRRFASELNFEWMSGLAIGMGPALVYGRQILGPIGIYRNVKKSIAITAQALAHGKSVPKEAEDLAAKPLIPKKAYTGVAIVIASILALKDGAWNLYRRPYIDEK